MDLKALLKDVESGLTDDEIMSKHKVSKEQLLTIYNSLVKVDRLTKRILGTKRKGHFLNESGESSSFYELYEEFNIGAEEREHNEDRLQNLRRNLSLGIIKPDEFQQSVRLLVRNLLKKHTKYG
jgi:hypothetical protein